MKGERYRLVCVRCHVAGLPEAKAVWAIDGQSLCAMHGQPVRPTLTVIQGGKTDA